MSKTQDLKKSARYRDFVNERDKVLEELLRNTNRRVTDILRGVFFNAMTVIEIHYRRAHKEEADIVSIRTHGRMLQERLDQLFLAASLEITKSVKRLRKSTFLLASAGESEAIGRAITKPVIMNVASQELDIVAGQPKDDATLESKILISLDTLMHKIISTFNRQLLISKPTDEALQRILLCFPKQKTYGERPIRKLKKILREADTPPKDEFATGFVDDAEWEDMLDLYRREVIPNWRGPEYVLDQKTPKASADDYYAWEMEQEITDDFVNMVRQGQVDAAKKNGIEDFVWIAVVDDRTDDCCLWRDGLTTTEIELRLKTDRKDDECQVTVPPAHFNCRCSLAPVTEALPEEPDSLVGEFEDWLNS